MVMVMHTCSLRAHFSRSTALPLALASVRFHFELVYSVRLQSANDHFGPLTIG